MSDMRAKMKIGRIEKHAENLETLHFNPVAASKYPGDGMDEDNTYAKFSPSGKLELTIANPALIGKFSEGETYYLDFTKVEA